MLLYSSHIPNAERLGKQSLDALLAYLGEETFDRINALRGELSKTNRDDIFAFEEDAAPDHKREVEKRQTARLKELSILKKNEPQASTEARLGSSHEEGRSRSVRPPSRLSGN